jgi:hypothetical protein
MQVEMTEYDRTSSDRRHLRVIYSYSRVCVISVGSDSARNKHIDSVITADACRQFGLLPGEQVDRRFTERAYSLIYRFLFVRLLYEAVSAADV